MTFFRIDRSGTFAPVEKNDTTADLAARWQVWRDDWHEDPAYVRRNLELWSEGEI